MKLPTRARLVIIGAGPAGISLAAEARRAGYAADEVIVLEKGEVHSWAIRKFYPDAKSVTANYKGSEAICHGVMCITDTSKDGLLSYLDQAIEDHQLHVHYGETVSMIHSRDGLVVDASHGSVQAETVAIAIGILGRPNKPGYRLPASLRKRLHFDLSGDPVEGAEVLVVGGGDSASEYAQFLAERGNRVTLSYRRAAFARMNDINRESLLALAGQGRVALLNPSNVTGITAEEGAPLVAFEEPELGARRFDHVVFALGGTTPTNFLKSVGIAFDGPVPRLTEGHQTTISGLYLVGDLTAGRKGGSIIAAFNSAHAVMRQIDGDEAPAPG